jgi:hypothetical protein
MPYIASRTLCAVSVGLPLWSPHFASDFPRSCWSNLLTVGGKAVRILAEVSHRFYGTFWTSFGALGAQIRGYMRVLETSSWMVGFANISIGFRTLEDLRRIFLDFSRRFWTRSLGDFSPYFSAAPPAPSGTSKPTPNGSPSPTLLPGHDSHHSSHSALQNSPFSGIHVASSTSEHFTRAQDVSYAIQMSDGTYMSPMGQVVEFAGLATLADTGFGTTAAEQVHNVNPPLIPDASTTWNPDTGATSHMTPHRHWFHEYSPCRIPIRLADNNIVYAVGVGAVRFQPVGHNGKFLRPLQFERVLHVPALRNNLLSVLYLSRQKGYHILIKDSAMQFRRDGRFIFSATVDNSNAASLDGHIIPVQQFSGLATTLPLDLSLWHRRFGHLNHSAISAMHRNQVVKGLTIASNSKPDPICEPCIAGKQHRNNVPKTASRASGVLDRVYMDLHGPLPVASREGYRYWALFVDDASRFWTVAFLKEKSEAFSAFVAFKEHAEKQTGRKLKCAHDDKGGEWMSNEMKDFCIRHGIVREHTMRAEPHQNGVAERPMRTLGEGIISMLTDARLSASWWADAAAAFVRIHNRSGNSALHGKTPYEAFYGQKPDVSLLRVFGSTAYVHVKRDKRNSLESHTKKCIFVGYPAEYKGWQFWHPESRQLFISDTAIFDERSIPGVGSFPPASALRPASTPSLHPQSFVEFLLPEDEPDQVGVLGRNRAQVPLPPASPPLLPATPPRVPSPAQSEDELLLRPAHQAEQPLAVRRPRRVIRPPVDWRQPVALPPAQVELEDDADAPELPDLPPVLPQDDAESDDELLLTGRANLAAMLTPGTDLDPDLALELVFKQLVPHTAFAAKKRTPLGEPNSFSEAMRRPDASMWYDAAATEIRALVENGTWELVKLPPGKKAIGCRWVFRVKRNVDGTVERYKGRLVAQGFSQRPGIDYDETFAPTPRWAAIRAVLALAALEDLELESVDISSAFLNGELEEEVYMRQPEGFEEGTPDYVCRLIKSLYGLKQSPRCWHIKLNSVLSQMGFERILCDHSIWVWRKDDSRIIVPVFVDDMTLAGKDAMAIAQVKKDLATHFKLRDLGPTSRLLGVHITRNRSTRTLQLSQRQYILDILNHHGFTESRAVNTPMDPGLRLSAHGDRTLTPQQEEELRKFPYMTCVGELLYLAVATRPDIARTVSVLCRYNANPGYQHMLAVKHLWRYLRTTIDVKLTYRPDPKSPDLFTTFCDADHGGCADTGHSTSGWVVKMGTGAISWMSKLQSIVALSTTEAEYVAACSAGQEILWLRHLFAEFGYALSSPSTLHMDNRSALSVARNPEHHGRMKHLDLRFYWLRDCVNDGQMAVEYLPTNQMPADILTKSLAHFKVVASRTMLGLV